MDELSLQSQLAALGIYPKKGLGQNFLVDPSHRSRIVAAAGLGPDDAVLEIGPGLGALTDLIVRQAGRVVAVELDDRLISFLRERYADQPHVTIVHGDMLRLDVGALMTVDQASLLEKNTVPASGRSAATGYKVIANLPYYITAAAVRHLLESSPPPQLLVLTVQREVAERMVAVPPKMSLLAVSVQYYCSARLITRLPAGAFFPVPKVDSAVIALERRPPDQQIRISADRFFRVAKAGFSRPRKQLRNALAAGLGVSTSESATLLSAAGIDPSRRAETLALSEWAGLAAAGN